MAVMPMVIIVMMIAMTAGVAMQLIRNFANDIERPFMAIAFAPDNGV